MWSQGEEGYLRLYWTGTGGAGVVWCGGLPGFQDVGLALDGVGGFLGSGNWPGLWWNRRVIVSFHDFSSFIFFLEGF